MEPKKIKIGSDMEGKSHSPEPKGESAKKIAELEEQLKQKDEEVRSLKDQLDQRQGEVDSLLGQLKREISTSMNRQQIQEREKRLAIERANESVLFELAGIYDNFQRALCALETSPDNPVKQGVLLISKQLGDLLKKEGVEEIPGVGALYDCNLHEADCFEETNVCPEGTITAELQKGYRYKGRILRPAHVRVAKQKTKPEERLEE